MERAHWAISVIWIGNRSQASLGTHLTTRRRQTGGVTFSCSRDPWDTEAHVGLSPPPPDLGILGDSWKHAEVATEMHGTEQQQMSQAAEHMLCIAMGNWGG